jgi:hypothetical protein
MNKTLALNPEEQRLLDLLQRATPGPWHPAFSAHGDPAVNGQAEDHKGLSRIATVTTSPGDYGRANALLIAGAVNALEGLLVRKAALEVENGDLRRAVPLIDEKAGVTWPSVDDNPSVLRGLLWQAHEEVEVLQAERDALIGENRRLLAGWEHSRDHAAQRHGCRGGLPGEINPL